MTPKQALAWVPVVVALGSSGICAGVKVDISFHAPEERWSPVPLRQLLATEIGEDDPVPRQPGEIWEE